MVRRFALLILLALICSCSNGSSGTSGEVFTGIALRDFVPVSASGKYVFLGSDDEGALASERPKMKVVFDYDFSIGQHEVTRGEFYGVQDSADFPVTDVSFFDAVLYANAKSKAENMDTAYTYISSTMDENGHCTNLEGFKFNPDVVAYRLPTEAEWMFVAASNWNPEKSWSNGNSGQAAHKVCSAEDVKNSPAESAVCDMAGNVMEWVNDWAGAFADTTVSNYIGAPDGGSLGERVVKGGSFRNSAESMRVYNRGDVYTVTSSTRAKYVGFRLAFGAIPNAVWMENDGLVQTSHMTLLSDMFTIRKKTGTMNEKLVFRNDLTGNLVFVDYSAGRYSAVEIKDSIDSYHPDISPDGRRVAFCTGLEGVSGNSKVYVRNLDESGSGLVKLDVESAAIPRWKVLDSGDTVIVYVTDAGNNSSDASFMKSSTWQVPFKSGKFGTPQKIFDGAYHGGVSKTLSVSGARLLRAKTATADTIWYNSEQACNASLSKDGTNRTLFLDFGGNTGREFAGTKYDTHEMLLVADSTGNLIKALPSPKGYTFDHSEWIDENLAIVTLVNISGVHGRISILDMRDSSLVDLVEGEEIWHPAFWVKPSSIKFDVDESKYDVDSLCAYFDGVTDYLLSIKMNLFWSAYDSLKVVALGSSRMSQGFAAGEVTFGKTLNMATVPSDMDVSYYVAMNYALKACNNLEAIVVGLDLDLWSDKSEVNFLKNAQSFPGYFYDRNHDFWSESDYPTMSAVAKKNIDESDRMQGLQLSSGWVAFGEKNSWSNGGFNAVGLVGDSLWSDSPDTYEMSLRELESLIRTSQMRGVFVVGVVFPQSPDFMQTGAFGRHGMRRSHAEKIIRRIDAMQQSYKNFVLMDENKMGLHDYPDSLAYDYDHLNKWGAQKITARIDSVLHEMKRTR